jgi:hypothetical protein
MNSANQFQRRDELVSIIARAVSGKQNASVSDEIAALEKALDALAAHPNTPKPEPSGVKLAPPPAEATPSDPEAVLANVSGAMTKAALGGGTLPGETRAALTEQLRGALRHTKDPRLSGRIVSTIRELRTT